MIFRPDFFFLIRGVGGSFISCRDTVFNSKINEIKHFLKKIHINFVILELNRLNLRHFLLLLEAYSWVKIAWPCTHCPRLTWSPRQTDNAESQGNSCCQAKTRGTHSFVWYCICPAGASGVVMQCVEEIMQNRVKGKQHWAPLIKLVSMPCCCHSLQVSVTAAPVRPASHKQLSDLKEAVGR